MTGEQPVSYESQASKFRYRKIGISGLAVGAIALIAYFGGSVLLTSDSPTEDERQPVTINRSTLTEAVSASGSVTFPELESVRFDISGTVGTVRVEEGDTVDQGQVLIELDAVTVSVLESAVANAELAVKDAGENLAELLGGASNLERVVAESDLADARVASMNASNSLADFSSADGESSQATISAIETLADANDVLSEALVAAADSKEAQDELIAEAQEIFDDAELDYHNQLTGWFGINISAEDRELSPEALYTKWDITVDQIILESSTTAKSPQDDPSTPWNELIVWVWTHLTPYPVFTNCDETSDQYQFRCPSAELDSAWDAVTTAHETLIDVMNNAGTEAKSQEVLIDTARDAVESAAESVVETTNEIEIAALAATLAEKLQLEIEAEVAISELDNLEILEIKLATADVNQANAQLESAISELDSAKLVAPFAGVISSISVSVGDPVTRSTPIIDVLDPSVVTVEGTVDEIDALLIAVGDAVAIEIDALPDQILNGVIDEIGDGVNQQGVVEFPLTIRLTPPEEVDLIEGLSATATIVLNEVSNALLAPLQAVGGSFTQPTIDVVTDEGFVTTEVTLGASDDFWVVIETGLVEGQQVLITVAEAVDPFQQFFGGGGPGAGGGFGGPGGGGGF